MSPNREDMVRDIEELLPQLMRGLFPADSPLAHVALGQLKLMRLLERHTSLRVTEAAAALGMTKGAITQHVHGLEAKDLIVRRESESDGRVRSIELTETGRALFRQHREARIAAAIAKLELCDPATVANFRDALQQLVSHLGAEDPLLSNSTLPLITL